MQCTFLRLFVLLLAALVATSASSFEADGYRSGMTRSNVQSIAESRGLEAWQVNATNIAIGKRSQHQVLAIFAFCEDSLMWLSRPLNFDADYTFALKDLLTTYGQPRNVDVSSQPFSGPNGGIVHSVALEWNRESDRVTLSFSPEGRDGTGGLRHYRSASLAHQVIGKCLASKQ